MMVTLLQIFLFSINVTLSFNASIPEISSSSSIATTSSIATRRTITSTSTIATTSTIASESKTLSTSNSFSTTNDNREFCAYTNNDVVKIINPTYLDFNNNTVYFQSIEDYAKYIGPNWIGVSYCGNDTLVNNFGEYFKIVESKEKVKHEKRDATKKDKDESKEESKDESIDDIFNNIYRARTKEDIKQEYEKIYKHLMKNGIRNVALTSINPAYNPYHKSLIKVQGIKEDETNIIQTMGIPYDFKESQGYAILMNGTKSDMENCGRIYNMKDSSITCSITFSTDIQDTISISTNEGVTFHKSYGTVISEGDTTTKEINNHVDLARAISNSKSQSGSKSEGVTNSFEKVYSVVISNSNSTTDNVENTDTHSEDSSYTYTMSEDHTHSRTKDHSETNERNWSTTDETSHTEEYSRMDMSDYDAVKDKVVAQIPKVNGTDGSGGSEPGDESGLDKILNFVDGGFNTAADWFFEFGNSNNEHRYEMIKNGVVNAVDHVKGFFKDAYDIGKRAWNDVTNKSKRSLEKRANINVTKNTSSPSKSKSGGGKKGGTSVRGIFDSFTGAEGNRIQREAIRSEEAIAAEQANLQYQLALAGTRSSSDTETHSETNGGSKSVTDGWSETNSDSSGINKSWGTSKGDSKAHTTGHSETSTKEQSNTDSTSKMLSKTFNEETGWVNENSISDTRTEGYTFGSSIQRNTNNQISYDKAIDNSVQYSYEKSNSTSISKTSTKQVTYNIKDNSCYYLTALPMFNSEVVIFANGYTTSNHETKVRYSSSIIPKEFIDFTVTPIKCNEEKNYVDKVINSEFEKFKFIKIGAVDELNTLRSGSVLTPNEFIVSDSGRYSFGLLPNGNLVLCEGSKISSNCNKVWSSGITTVPTNHSLKFFIGDNGHLYVTAKNIYKENVSDAKYSEEFIGKIKDVINKNIDSDDEEIENLKILLNDYCTKFNIDNCNTLQKRGKRPPIAKTLSTLSVPTQTHTKTSTTNTTSTTSTTSTTNTIDTINTVVTKTTNNVSSPTSITASSTPDSSETPNNYTDDSEYIIWDSLPKDLPFNVGYPDNKGYFLHIKDEDDLNGASVSLYDGLGVKIWEIKAYQNDYKGYAFPVEYVYPLLFDTALDFKYDEDYYDKHNVLNEKNIKNLKTNRIKMECGAILHQNEYLVSKNGRYKFFVQDTGNMVIKDNSRTTWSSMTANIELFEKPYHLAFTPLGEFILRDKWDLAIWQSLNLLSLNNKEPIESKYNFYLTLSDEGELFVEDDDHNMYWSNWNIRLYGQHLRYVNPVKYEITSCNEHVRSKHIYNLFSEPGIYDYSEIIEDEEVLVKKYYFNNLLPGELLLSKYNAYLNVTENDLIFHYEVNNNINEMVLKSCATDGGIKELKLSNEKLSLYCKGKNNKNVERIIAQLHPKSVNKYNRLSIEFRDNMSKPDLMIFNVDTWEPLWGLSNIAYLTVVKENELSRDEYNRININNEMALFDRLISNQGDGNFVYISNKYGLEFTNSAILPNIKKMHIKNNNFCINDINIVNDNKNLKLTYNGNEDKLILANNTSNHIWELYGRMYKCNNFISNDAKCNIIYSYNQINITTISPDNEKPNGMIYFHDKSIECLDLKSENIYTSEKFVFDMSKYININEPIFSLSITPQGNIELNNNKYIFHQEYYKADEYYYMYIENKNLILRSNTGEYKWAMNKTISNRPYDADEIKIGDSFKEGEMLYCGDYSVIILDGKLLYRDHKKQTSTEINYTSSNSAYLYKIVVGSNSFSFRDKNNEDIDNILSDRKSNNSRLRCDKSNHGIVWDNGNNKILWKYSPSNSFNPKSSAVWLYNKYYNKCLYTNGFKNEPITYEDCADRNKYKWYFEKIDGNTYFISAAKQNLCLRVIKNRMTLGECDEKAILKYIKASKSIKSSNKCLSGIDDNNDPYSQYEVKLSSCNRHDEKQMWEFISDISTITN